MKNIDSERMRAVRNLERGPETLEDIRRQDRAVAALSDLNRRVFMNRIRLSKREEVELIDRAIAALNECKGAQKPKRAKHIMVRCSGPMCVIRARVGIDLELPRGWTLCGETVFCSMQCVVEARQLKYPVAERTAHEELEKITKAERR